MDDKVPPLPPGFTLDADPPLPPGFTVDVPETTRTTDVTSGGSRPGVLGFLQDVGQRVKTERLDPLWEDIKATPRIAAKTLTRGLPAAGGAMIGAASPVPGGAIMGAGLGYSIGGRLEELLGLEDRPSSVLEATGRAIGDIPTGMMYEMGGQLANRGLEKILAPRAEKITPQGAQLQQTLEKAGVTPSPVDVAPGPVLRRVEALADKQIGGGRIGESARREIDAMRGNPATGEEGWLAKEARRVSGTEHQLDSSRVARGETIQNGLKEMATVNRELSGVEWEVLKIHDTGVPDFPVENLREAMRQKMAQAGVFEQFVNPGTSSRLTSSGGSPERGTWRPESTRGASGGARTYRPDEPGPRPRPRRANEPFVTEQAVHGVPESEIVSGLARNEGPVTFEQARAGRAALGKLYDKDPKTWGGPLGALNKDMDAYAANNASRMADYTKAKSVTRELVVPFNRDQPLGQLIDRNEPISVVRELMQPRDARINLLKAIKQQTGGTGPVWQATNSEAITQALENPRVLTNMGPETKNLLFTPEQRGFLDELQNWMQTSSAIKKVGGSEFAKTGQNVVALEGIREGVGAARQFATLVLGGGAAAAGGAAGGLPGILAGGSIALFPNVVARMLTNPRSAYWLMQGVKTPANTAEALRITSQLYPAYMKAMGDEARESKQRDMQKMLQGGR